MSNEQDASGQPNTDTASQAAAAPAVDSLLADAPAAAADGAAPADEKPAPTAEEAAAAAEAQAAADAEAKAKEVPEQYEDFAAPEGVTLDADTTGEFKTLAKELGLPQSKAQQVVDLGAKLVQKAEAQRAEVIQQEVAKWAADSRADKEFGGEKLAENLAGARNVVETFGSPELKTMLNESGLGNHPEVIRMLHRVSKAISEDQMVKGKAAPAAPDAVKSMYDKSEMN